MIGRLNGRGMKRWVEGMVGMRCGFGEVEMGARCRRDGSLRISFEGIVRKVYSAIRVRSYEKTFTLEQVVSSSSYHSKT